MAHPPLFKKTRIAPTPSGFLHLGNVLSFSLTAALAKKTKASILLRIDDLDQHRVGKEYIQDIFDTLNFLELPWNEGPADTTDFEEHFSQLHRLDSYRQMLQQLADAGAVFACTCSRAQILKESPNGVYPGTCRDKNLPLETKDSSWRLRTEIPITLKIKIYPNDGIETTLPAEMRDFVVRKRDGFPAYQLTSLVDDLHFGIDLIVRGQDLWPSTLAQHYLSHRLDSPHVPPDPTAAPAAPFRDITFYHHPLLLADGQKLSKSAGDTSIQQLRKQGLKPPDIYSLISRQLGCRETAHNWEELAALADALNRSSA